VHGRRYWTKALDAKDTRAALPIAAYKKLYEIEAKIRGLAPAGKLAVRQVESKPVFRQDRLLGRGLQTTRATGLLGLVPRSGT
jgi:hypothetical protein